MLFRFRICSDPDRRDDAQGWVVADCELIARGAIGVAAQLQKMPANQSFDVPNGTVLVTSGTLPLRSDSGSKVGTG